jgi:4-amino-4-deoxy-L-arabinose transferase-like glycosyltransferase
MAAQEGPRLRTFDATGLAGATLDWRALVALALFALLCLAPGIYSLPPTDRDESRYAVASTQMLQSGDFIDIRYLDQPRYLQPAGVYWLQSAAVAATTGPETRAIGSYRIPSVLAAVLAVVMTAALAAQLFGRNAGIAAGVLLAASFAVNFEARIAKTDAALLAAIVLAQWGLLRVYLEDSPHWRWPLMFWGGLGIGLMLKGPIILIFCGLTIATLCVLDRQVRWLKRLRPIWGVPVFLALTLPWYIAIAVVSEGEFYIHSVGRNLLGKVAESQQSHDGPPGYYLALFPLAFWPGALFVALAGLFAVTQRRDPRVRFLLAWAIPGWIVYEIVATKLPHYVVPTYPALAALAGAAWFAGAQAGPAWVRWAGYGFAAVWLAAGVLLAAAGPYAIYHFEQTIAWDSIALGSVGVGLMVACLWLVARRQRMAAIAAAGLAGLLVFTTTFAISLPRVETLWLSARVADAAHAVAPCPLSPLTTTRYREPSLAFLYGPEAFVLVDTPAQSAEALARNPACGLALIDASEEAAFRARADSLDLPVTAKARVAGLNYSNGDAMDLTVFASGPAPGR